jgi:hypothetical protein
MPDPKTSTLTKLYHCATKTGEKIQVGFIQGIPEFLKAPEPVNYSALDIDDERQTKGRKKAETLEIEILFKEDQYDVLKALADAETNEFWFIQLPNDTAVTANKPLTWNFQATCFIGMSEIAIDDMLKSKLTLYRNSGIEETKGFPVLSI